MLSLSEKHEAVLKAGWEMVGGAYCGILTRYRSPTGETRFLAHAYPTATGRDWFTGELIKTTPKA